MDHLLIGLVLALNLDEDARSAALLLVHLDGKNEIREWRRHHDGTSSYLDGEAWDLLLLHPVHNQLNGI